MSRNSKPTSFLEDMRNLDVGRMADSAQLIDTSYGQTLLVHLRIDSSGRFGWRLVAPAFKAPIYILTTHKEIVLVNAFKQYVRAVLELNGNSRHIDAYNLLSLGGARFRRDEDVLLSSDDDLSSTSLSFRLIKLRLNGLKPGVGSYRDSSPWPRKPQENAFNAHSQIKMTRIHKYE